MLLEDRCTRFFKIGVGLRQGCILSPILFIIYINGLAEAINQTQLGARIVLNKKGSISILMFADDIALISEDRKNLEKLMEITLSTVCATRGRQDFSAAI